MNWFKKEKSKEPTKKLSLFEYFKLKGLKEAQHIEVTYEDGSKVALDGRIAMMWWRGINMLLMDNPDYINSIEKFRPIDEKGNLITPKTLPELIEEHDWSTGFCSFAGHMRGCSSTYGEIMKYGEKALPDILEYLRQKKGGMNIVLLLEDITHTSPYEPEKIGETGFVGYKVGDCIDAWLKWGIKKGYIYD
jgi:hypothetical protein